MKNKFKIGQKVKGKIDNDVFFGIIIGIGIYPGKLLYKISGGGKMILEEENLEKISPEEDISLFM